MLLPGTHRTSSYLAVAGPRAEPACTRPATAPARWSPSSSTGGSRRTDPRGGSTRRYRYDDAAPTLAAHFDDNGVNAALRVLVRNGLVTPVARMRPLAVLH